MALSYCRVQPGVFLRRELFAAQLAGLWRQVALQGRVPRAGLARVERRALCAKHTRADGNVASQGRGVEAAAAVGAWLPAIVVLATGACAAGSRRRQGAAHGFGYAQGLTKFQTRTRSGLRGVGRQQHGLHYARCHCRATWGLCNAACRWCRGCWGAVGLWPAFAAGDARVCRIHVEATVNSQQRGGAWQLLSVTPPKLHVLALFSSVASVAIITFRLFLLLRLLVCATFLLLSFTATHQVITTVILIIILIIIVHAERRGSLASGCIAGAWRGDDTAAGTRGGSQAQHTWRRCCGGGDS